MISQMLFETDLAKLRMLIFYFECPHAIKIFNVNNFRFWNSLKLSGPKIVSANLEFS